MSLAKRFHCHCKHVLDFLDKKIKKNYYVVSMNNNNESTITYFS